MDDFFGAVVVIIVVVAALAQKAKQGQARKQARRPMPVPMAAGVPDIPAPAARKAPAAEQTMLPPRAAAMPQEAILPSRAADLPQRPVMAPRVQPTMDAPEDAAELYAGSMRADTHEGEDPCHPQEERDVPRMAPVPVETPGLRLNFSGDSLMQALVMQEVLKRPCQRRG